MVFATRSRCHSLADDGQVHGRCRGGGLRGLARSIPRTSRRRRFRRSSPPALAAANAAVAAPPTEAEMYAASTGGARVDILNSCANEICGQGLPVENNPLHDLAHDERTLALGLNTLQLFWPHLGAKTPPVLTNDYYIKYNDGCIIFDEAFLYFICASAFLNMLDSKPRLKLNLAVELKI
jgi:hypothetical protein